MHTVPEANETAISAVTHLHEILQQPRNRHLQIHLSLRQLIRALQMHAVGASLHRYIRDSCLSEFLPAPTRRAFELLLQQAGIADDSTTRHAPSTSPSQQLRSTAIEHDALHHVPNVVFFDNEAQEAIMAQMKQELDLGHHLLLQGNQVRSPSLSST